MPSKRGASAEARPVPRRTRPPVAGANSAPQPRNTNSLRPQKTATLVAQRIVSEIAEQNLPAGAALPSERRMLEEYGVARGTLREALRFLEIQGVITIRTGSGGGPVVAGPTSKPLASTIAMMLQLRGTQFRDLIETRLVVETTLASRAAERATQDDISALKQSVERMRSTIDDGTGFLPENEVFHSTIWDAADNQVLALVASSINWIWAGVPYPEYERSAVLDAHVRIARAIESGKPDRASAAMHVHITDYSNYLERLYPHMLDAPVQWSQV